MPKKIPVGDVIVLLPGIMGSVLQKDKKDFFALSCSAGWRAFISRGESLGQLLLQGDDPDGKDLEDGVFATRLMSDAHLIPGFFKVDGYTKISEFITQTFDVIKGSPNDATKPANYFEFPYDWRRYNCVSAVKLQKLINERLPQWRESSGNDTAKVVLIGHSMGGLVARYYLEKLEGWKDCRALITFGTPYRGSVNALNFLSNGYKKRLIDLSEVLRSFSSAYELLPIYRVIDVAGDFKRIEDVAGIPGIDSARVARARNDFHEQIIKAVEAHQKDVAYRNSYKIIPIVGTRQPTLQAATFTNGVLTANEIVPSKNEDDQLLAEGDGTVPRLSATPIELSLDYRETYFAERHASLQNNDYVLADLRQRLKQTQTNLSQFREAVPSAEASERPAISLRLEDLYSPEEPIRMTARLVNVTAQQNKAPTARITTEEGALVLERTFAAANDEWEFVVHPIPPGFYRVTVWTDELETCAPKPVHDIFVV
jgi:hypothetical protein